MKRACLAAGALLLPLAIAGCGSAVNASLGLDSRAEVKLISRDIQSMHLIVSPHQGPPTDPLSCTDSSNGFGCNRILQSDSTTLSYTTDSTMSSRPSYVYIQNTAAATQTATLQIRMDGGLQVNQAFDVPANTTLRVARIFRNNADTH